MPTNLYPTAVYHVEHSTPMLSVQPETPSWHGPVVDSPDMQTSFLIHEQNDIDAAADKIREYALAVLGSGGSCSVEIKRTNVVRDAVN